MSVHDWTRVGAGIFHAFHHSWIEEISRALNHGLLPSEYYALPEQHAAGFGPDVLTLQGDRDDGIDVGSINVPSSPGGGVLLAPPKLQPVAETELGCARGGGRCLDGHATVPGTGPGGRGAPGRDVLCRIRRGAAPLAAGLGDANGLNGYTGRGVWCGNLLRRSNLRPCSNSSNW